MNSTSIGVQIADCYGRGKKNERVILEETLENVERFF